MANNKKFSYKSDFQQIEINLEIDDIKLENVKFTELNVELDNDNLSYVNILKNILREDENKDEVLETIRKGLKSETLMKLTNDILGELSGN